MRQDRDAEGRKRGEGCPLLWGGAPAAETSRGPGKLSPVSRLSTSASYAHAVPDPKADQCVKGLRQGGCVERRGSVELEKYT